MSRVYIYKAKVFIILQVGDREGLTVVIFKKWYYSNAGSKYINTAFSGRGDSSYPGLCCAKTPSQDISRLCLVNGKWKETWPDLPGVGE